MGQQIWESYVQTIRLKELLYFQALNPSIKEVLFHGKCIKVECLKLSEMTQGFQLFKNTINDFVLKTYILYDGKNYTLICGKEVDLGLYHNGENLFEPYEDEMEKLSEIFEKYMMFFIKQKNIPIEKLDIYERLVNRIKQTKK